MSKRNGGNKKRNRSRRHADESVRRLLEAMHSGWVRKHLEPNKR